MFNRITERLKDYRCIYNFILVSMKICCDATGDPMKNKCWYHKKFFNNNVQHQLIIFTDKRKISC